MKNARKRIEIKNKLNIILISLFCGLDLAWLGYLIKIIFFDLNYRFLLSAVLFILLIVVISIPYFISQLLLWYGTNSLINCKMRGLPKWCVLISLGIAALLFISDTLFIFSFGVDIFVTKLSLCIMYGCSFLALVLYTVGKCLTRRRNTEQEVSVTNQNSEFSNCFPTVKCKKLGISMRLKRFGIGKLLLIVLAILFLCMDLIPVMHYIGVILQDTSHPDDAKAQGIAFFILILGVIPTVLFCVDAQVLLLLGLNSLLKYKLHPITKFCAWVATVIPVLPLVYVVLAINDIVKMNDSALIIGVSGLLVSFVLQLIVWASARRNNNHCAENEMKV
jgi:hypothetical protein